MLCEKLRRKSMPMMNQQKLDRSSGRSESAAGKALFCDCCQTSSSDPNRDLAIHTCKKDAPKMLLSHEKSTRHHELKLALRLDAQRGAVTLKALPSLGRVRSLSAIAKYSKSFHHFALENLQIYMEIFICENNRKGGSTEGCGCLLTCLP